MSESQSGSCKQTWTSGQQLPPGMANCIVVWKAAHVMQLYRGDSLLAQYRIALGNPHGKKTVQGDKLSPEGLYFISGHNPSSKYNLALNISYPNAEDRARAANWALAHGKDPRQVSPGGDVEIHGSPNGWEETYGSPPGYDWTIGCFAVTNAEIRKIWSMVSDNTPILIRA